MTYARIENDAVAEYPVFEGDIRLRYSNVSFPRPFSPPPDYVAVESSAQPEVTYTQNVTEGSPSYDGSKWVQTWVASEASSEEIAQRIQGQWVNVRADRNARLLACDWTQLSDAPLSNDLKAQWAAYRQSLRDVTRQPDPFVIEWPVVPA